MRAALVTELGREPDVADVPEPEPAQSEQLVDVLAAPLNPLDIAVGAGTFYGGHPDPPYVPGCEAVGRLRGSDDVVWVFGGGLGIRRNGTVAQVAVAPPGSLYAVPTDADPLLAAALGIAGLAGWMPVARRAPVRAGETVLVLGATGTAGTVALQAARLLGAGRVVAAGRDPEALARASELGADATVRLDDTGDVADRLREACGGDGPTLIVDPLWGDAVLAALEAAAPGARVVHFGQSAGAEARLPSRLVRGKQLEILGYSDFAAPHDVLEEEYHRLLGHASSGAIRLPIERFGLDRIAEAWRRQAGGPHAKIVVVP